MTPRTLPPLGLLPLSAWTLALAAATATAQAPGAGPEAPALEQSLEENAAQRVVLLASGDFLRARTRRLADGRWQYFAKGDWSTLPGVERATLERTLLAQAKGLAKEVRGEPVRRVALADWMARQGLGLEALRELDRVLEEDPDQADALRLLTSPPRSLDFYRRRESAEELFALAVKAPPALRELALTRVAELDSTAVLSARLREGLASHSARTRAAAARGLGRFFPGEEIEGLLVRSVLDGSEDVRLQAAVSLGLAQEPAVILPLVRALGSDHGAVRVNAISALADAGYPAAVAPLMTSLASVQSGGGGGRAPGANIFVGKQIAYVQDFDVEVALGASVADPSIGVLTEGAALDVRVQGIATHSVAVESRYLRSALGRLTGADPGSTNRAWLEWWKQNQGDWN